MEIRENQLRLLVIIPLFFLIPIIFYKFFDPETGPLIEFGATAIALIMGIKCLVFAVILMLKTIKSNEKKAINTLTLVIAFICLILIVYYFRDFINPFANHENGEMSIKYNWI